MSALDYSKWDHIEISDDEDDTHPNIDTPSLFRWRHQARMDRMEEQKKEKEKIDREKLDLEERKKTMMKQALDESKKQEALAKIQEIQKQEEEWRKKEEEFEKKQKLQPWNVDTICHEGFSKSVINKDKKEEKLSDEEEMKRQREFTKLYQKELQEFGMMRKADDSQKYLQDHPHLICDKAANYLVIWCIDLEVEEKHALMETVAHQTIILQFILELAKSLKQDPRNCFIAFFRKFKNADQSYIEGFHDELKSFKERVKERARIRIQTAMEEIEKEERAKRMGPGGLDPQDVFESLPKEMQECFEKRDLEMLQTVIGEMDPEVAKHHMKRCVDSGLWVPGGGDTSKSEASTAEEEETYSEIKE